VKICHIFSSNRYYLHSDLQSGTHYVAQNESTTMT